MTQTKTLTVETKAVKKWFDWLYQLAVDDDDLTTFRTDCMKALKKCQGDNAKFAQAFVKWHLKDEGYHTFSNTAVGFLDEFVAEAMKRCDWQWLGAYFVRKVNL